MGLTPRGARLWHALDLGPFWVDRAAASAADSDLAAAQAAAADPAAASANAPDEIGQMDWDALEQAVAGCTACGLCRTRTRTVFGAGSRQARWLFIGEAPGAEEDARGEPFVGQAGRLLDNLLAEAGLGRKRAGSDAVFIANVLKCRPPANRNPEPAEVSACSAFLQRQIDLLDPALIVVMGRFASQAVLQTDASLSSLRGRVHVAATPRRRYPVIVTYHPAYLLRNLADKARSWEDLCLARTTFAGLATS
jgi:DNA polymerase